MWKSNNLAPPLSAQRGGPAGSGRPIVLHSREAGRCREQRIAAKAQADEFGRSSIPLMAVDPLVAGADKRGSFTATACWMSGARLYAGLEAHKVGYGGDSGKIGRRFLGLDGTPWPADGGSCWLRTGTANSPSRGFGASRRITSAEVMDAIARLLSARNRWRSHAESEMVAMPSPFGKLLANCVA